MKSRNIMILILIAALCLTALCGCGKKAEQPAEPQEAPSAGIANPIEIFDSYDGQLQRCGLKLLAPEGAENVVIKTIAGKTAETDFTLNGVEYYYRAEPTGELKTYDMSGLYYSWTKTEQAKVGYCDAEVRTGDSCGFVSWLDVVPGINYNLCSDKCGDAAKLVETANLVFVPTQGDADGDPYIGSFSAENNSVEFTLNEQGGYNVVVGIYRLTTMEGKGNNMDGAVELELTDPNGGKMYGIFYPDGESYTLKITQSTWELLPAETMFEGFVRTEG